MFLELEAAAILEPAGISLCCYMIDLWTALEGGSCSGLLYHGSLAETN